MERKKKSIDEDMWEIAESLVKKAKRQKDCEKQLSLIAAADKIYKGINDEDFGSYLVESFDELGWEIDRLKKEFKNSCRRRNRR